MTDEPIIINHKQALLELCARNIIKYRRGLIRFNHDLKLQIQYFAKEAPKEMLSYVLDEISMIRWANNNNELSDKT